MSTVGREGDRANVSGFRELREVMGIMHEGPAAGSRVPG